MCVHLNFILRKFKATIYQSLRVSYQGNVIDIKIAK